MKNYHIKVYSAGKQVLNKREVMIVEKNGKESEYTITFNWKKVKNK